MVKSLPANAGDIRDASLIPRSERSPGGGMATHSSILSRESHGRRSPVGYSPGGLMTQTILGIIFHILVINIILYFYVEIYNFMTLIAKVYFMLNYFWS